MVKNNRFKIWKIQILIVLHISEPIQFGALSDFHYQTMIMDFVNGALILNLTVSHGINRQHLIRLCAQVEITGPYKM